MEGGFADEGAPAAVADSLGERVKLFPEEGQRLLRGFYGWRAGSIGRFGLLHQYGAGGFCSKRTLGCDVRVA